MWILEQETTKRKNGRKINEKRKKVYAEIHLYVSELSKQEAGGGRSRMWCTARMEGKEWKEQVVRDESSPHLNRTDSVQARPLLNAGYLLQLDDTQWLY